jgi:hypothetical protein
VEGPPVFLERRGYMKRPLTIVMAALLGVFVIASAQAGDQKTDAAKEKTATEHAYVGVSKCGLCHKAEARGNQLAQWEQTAHARAYDVLAGDAAKEAAKKVGIEGEPQKSPECLKCHVTAYGVDKKLLGPKHKPEDGVGCESCHGPGEDYMKMSVMKDRERAIAAGLLIPDEETCLKCHNDESPTYKKFVFKEMYAKVAHPKPKVE